MSLVGPRPLPLRDTSLSDSWHHVSPPGSSLALPVYGKSPGDLPSKASTTAVRLDLHYIDNWSLTLDLDILIRNHRNSLFREGAY